jgi:hypothetical protein
MVLARGNTASWRLRPWLSPAHRHDQRMGSRSNLADARRCLKSGRRLAERSLLHPHRHNSGGSGEQVGRSSRRSGWSGSR